MIEKPHQRTLRLGDSRAHNWLLFCCAIALPLGAWCQIPAAEHDHSSVFQDRHILLTPLSPESLQAATEIQIPAERRRELAQILPLSLLLTNRTDKAILQVTLRYQSFPVRQGDRIGLFTMQLNSLTLNKQSGWIEPGRSVFLCPSSGLSALISSNSPTPVRARSEVATILRQFSSEWTSLVRVSLDSVAFEDGEVVGPDAFGVIEQQSETARGRADILVQTQQQFAAGDAELAGLSDWVRKAETTYHGMNLDTGRPDYYRTAQLGTAKSLLILRSHVDGNFFANQLGGMLLDANRALQPKIKLHKLTRE